MKDTRLSKQAAPRPGRAQRSQVAVVARYIQDLSTKRGAATPARSGWAGCAPVSLAQVAP
jgi:hypothetical protein